MDLTKIDKPFGELDDATKGALLLAHHRGEVIEYTIGNGWKVPLYVAWSDGAIYRVQPKPVIGEVVLYGVGPIYHSLHPVMTGNNLDYKIIVTFPTRNGKHVAGVYTSPEGLQIKIEVAE
jgi:hypothetical protein